MPCPTTPRGPFRCPTRDEVFGALLSLLPRCRAWQNTEGGPWPGGVLHGYWAAFVDVLAFVNQRLCDLRLEFWCATETETNDLWMQEYGLPDDCDPFPNLCVKVAALGGSRCEYFQEIVARMGWTIECRDGGNACGTRVGCARAGSARVGASNSIGLTVIMHLHESPVYLKYVRARIANAGAIPRRSGDHLSRRYRDHQAGEMPR